MRSKAHLATMRPAVLQVLPDLEDNDMARTTLAVAKALLADGWRAFVASSGGKLERELTALGATHVEMPLGSANPVVMYANNGRLARLVKHHSIDLIHARARGAAWSAGFAAKRSQTAFLTTFHDLYDHGDGGLKKRYSAVMTAGDRVIAVSDYVAEHLTEKYNVEPARIRTIHRGIDTSAFDPERVRGHRVSALAERWHLGFDRRIVMLPGRVVQSRGHLLALRAMARVKRDDFILLIVGDLDPEDGYVRQMEALLKTTGLAERVHFAGHCDDMPAAYMLADVVMLPATSPEAYGRVAIEAQAMGKPVIVTNVGGLSESVMPAATGWLVQPDSPEELAWALDLALALEEPVRGRIAERAREFVRNEFSIEQMCRRTQDVYRELVRRVPHQAPLTGTDRDIVSQSG